MREQDITNNKNSESQRKKSPKGIGVKNMGTTIEYQNFIDDVRSDLKRYILERWLAKDCLMIIVQIFF